MGCDLFGTLWLFSVHISIHAPRVGCDSIRLRGGIYWRISIHAPRVGCDPPMQPVDHIGDTFQSTHPVWGATNRPRMERSPHGYFNPRTPCGVRLSHSLSTIELPDFNPRTPCGVRRTVSWYRLASTPFQSTHPVWGATTHSSSTMTPRIFQSTHPVWGATRAECGLFDRYIEFQSTHPVWGATGTPLSSIIGFHHFNPRTPCGVRPRLTCLDCTTLLFQSTHPVWGATV